MKTKKYEEHEGITSLSECPDCCGFVRNRLFGDEALLICVDCGMCWEGWEGEEQ